MVLSHLPVLKERSLITSVVSKRRSTDPVLFQACWYGRGGSKMRSVALNTDIPDVLCKRQQIPNSCIKATGVRTTFK